MMQMTSTSSPFNTLVTTLNVLIKVTYYLELCDYTSIYSMHSILINKCKIGCLDIIEY